MCNHTTYGENSERSITNNHHEQKTMYSQSSCKYVYDGRKKRTEFGQLLQILEYLGSTDDVIISSISRSNNMSHDAATRNCEKLVSVGLVKRETTSDNKKFKLTSDGISFLNDCRNFRDILCNRGLCHTLCH